MSDNAVDGDEVAHIADLARIDLDDEEVERFTDEILPQVTDEGHWNGDAVVHTPDGGLIRERLALTHTTDGGHVCIVRGTEPIEESSPNVASRDATHPNAGDREDPDLAGSDIPDAVDPDRTD